MVSTHQTIRRRGAVAALVILSSAVLGWIAVDVWFDWRGPSPPGDVVGNSGQLTASQCSGAPDPAPMTSNPAKAANRSPTPVEDPRGINAREDPENSIEARVRDLPLRVSYEDGTPFSGQIRVRMGGRSIDLKLTSERPAVIAAVDSDNGLTLSLSSHRSGFVFRGFELSREELRECQEIRCVIPRSDEPNGTLGVDLSEYSADQTVWLRIEDDTGYTVFDSNTVNGGQICTAPVIRTLRPRRLRVVVISEAVWQSDWIVLNTGDNAIVVAKPVEPASLTARIVDEFGRPVLDAILYRETGRYCSSDDLKQDLAASVPGIEAKPDSEGLATLTHLHPGTQVICAQGQGTEVSRFTVVLLPGQRYELGDLRLVTASGAIEVSFRGSEQTELYRVELLQPLGSPLVEPEAIEGNRASFAKLPLRKYTVALVIKATGRCYWQNVELTETMPLARVEFDVSRPPPEEE